MDDSVSLFIQDYVSHAYRWDLYGSLDVQAVHIGKDMLVIFCYKTDWVFFYLTMYMHYKNSYP